MARISLFSLLLIAAFHVIAKARIDPKITEFVDLYSTESLVVATFMIAVLSFSLLESSIVSFKAIIAASLLSHDLDRRVRQLKPSDKLLLSRFVEEGRMNLQLNPEDPSVAWLESLKILMRSGESSAPGTFSYRIAPNAMDMFTKNPNLLR